MQPAQRQGSLSLVFLLQGLRVRAAWMMLRAQAGPAAPATSRPPAWSTWVRPSASALAQTSPLRSTLDVRSHDLMEHTSWCTCQHT